MSSPWRIAFGLCHALGLPLPDGGTPNEAELLQSQLASNVGVVQTSSAGRLFDAVSYLLGACGTHVSYEGQAAMQLEHLARTSSSAVPSEAGTIEELIAEVCLDDVLQVMS